MRQATKRCRHCGEDKTVEAFGANRRTRDGLSSWCKACHAERTQQWRAEHRDEINARRRAQHRSEKGADA